MTPLVVRMTSGLGWFVLMLAMTFGFASAASAEEAPHEFVERFSNDVLKDIKARKKELIADPAKLDALIDQKVMPNVNFRKMTQLAVGRPWRAATNEQREAVIEQFRLLLVKTYSSALSQVADQTLEVDKVRGAGNETDVVVNSRVVQKNAPPIDLAYRVEKKDGKWKIYDLSVLGLWLVDSYKAQFTPILNDSGMDGLVKTLKAKNGQA